MEKPVGIGADMLCETGSRVNPHLKKGTKNDRH
jgi:hypothetical protein